MLRAALKTIAVNLGVLLVAFLGLEGLVRLFIPVRNVGPAFAEYDPVYGKHMKVSYSTERVSPEFRMRFTTNSLGHRGPELSGATTGGILFLGDSYTEGYGVSDGQEYAALVRRHLQSRLGPQAPPVINTGMSDTGNGRSLKILLRQGAALAPRLVVLQLMNNDFGDNLREGLFALAQGELRELPGPAPGRPSAWGVHRIVETVPGLAHSYAISAIRQAQWSANARQHYTGASAGDELTYRIWERIFGLCRQQRWPLVILAVDLKPDRLARLRQLAAGTPVLVTPAPAEKPDLFFRVDGHWNQQGHQVVAQTLLTAIDALGVLGQP